MKKLKWRRSVIADLSTKKLSLALAIACAGKEFYRQEENQYRRIPKHSLNALTQQRKSIAGYAATSKSTTVLNFCGIDFNTIEYICDTTKEKIGKYSPGMHIPIVDMGYFYENQPDSIYLFAWNHKEEILKKENKFKGEWFSHVAL